MKVKLIALLLLIAQYNCTAIANQADEVRAHEMYIRSCCNFANPATKQLAIEQISESLRLNPKQPMYFFQKGFYISESEEHDEEALVYMDKALQINPKLANAWYLKYEILLRNNKPDKALVCIDKAIALSPRYKPWRARCLQRLHRFPEALKEADEVLKKKPEDSAILGLHADLARQLKNWPAVVSDTSKLLSLTDPKTPSYLSHRKARAEAYVELHQEDKAILDLEDAAKRSGYDRKIHSELLMLYKKKKDQKNIAKEEKILREMDEDWKP